MTRKCSNHKKYKVFCSECDAVIHYNEGYEQGKKDIAVNFDRLFKESYEQGKKDERKRLLEIWNKKKLIIPLIKELMKD